MLLALFVQAGTGLFANDDIMTEGPLYSLVSKATSDFFTDIHQTESNKAVEDLELITSVLREQLHINANKLGAAAGRVVIKDKGDLIDWSKLGSGGWSIPSNVIQINSIVNQ